MCAIAQEQHKWIISDEIHCDIVKAGHTHHMLESVAEEAARDRIITCVAPTKTFNIAGLECYPHHHPRCDDPSALEGNSSSISCASAHRTVLRSVPQGRLCGQR